MSKRHRWGVEETQELVRLRAGGASYSMLAHHFAATEQSVRAKLYGLFKGDFGVDCVDPALLEKARTVVIDREPTPSWAVLKLNRDFEEDTPRNPEEWARAEAYNRAIFEQVKRRERLAAERRERLRKVRAQWGETFGSGQ